MKPRLCDHNRPAKALTTALTTGDPPDLTGASWRCRTGRWGLRLQYIGNSGTNQHCQKECAGACTPHVDVRERAWHVQPTWEKTWPWGMGCMCVELQRPWRWLGMPHLDRGRTWVEWSYNWRQLMIVKDGTCRTETVRSSSPGGVDVRSAAFSVVHSRCNGYRVR